MTEHRFVYEITDELARAASRRFVRHYVGWRVPILFGVAALILVLICGSDEEGYVCGFLAGAFVLLGVLFFAAVALRNARATRALRKLPTREARCMLDDEGITVESALASTKVKWPTFEKLVRGPDVWLLFLTRQQYFALPADKLAGEPGAFIERRIAAAGGRLR